MLPQVDSFGAGRRLAGIGPLAEALAAGGDVGDRPRLMRLLRGHAARKAYENDRVLASA